MVDLFFSNFIADEIDEFASEDLEIIFSLISNQSPQKYFKVINFFDHILMNSINISDQSLKFTHISIPRINNEEFWSLFKEYLTLRLYFIGMMQLKDQQDAPIESRTLKCQYKADLKKIEEVISIEPGKRRKKLKEQRDKKKRLKKYYDDLAEIFNDFENGKLLYQHYTPKSILCLFKYDETSLIQELFKNRYFIIKADDFKGSNKLLFEKSSLVVSNSNHKFISLNNIHLGLNNSSSLFNSIKNIVIFPDSFNHIGRAINYDMLEDWNEYSGTDFKNLIVISKYDPGSSVYTLVEEKAKVKRQYSIPIRSANHTQLHICEYEYDRLVNIDSNEAGVKFVELDSLIYSQYINILREYGELRELISIKMRNLISVCYDDHIKDYLIKSVFGQEETKLITKETKKVLNEIDFKTRSKIKDLFEKLLDNVITSNILNVITSSNYKYIRTILFDYNILHDEYLRNQLQRRFKVYFDQLITWREFKENSEKDILIISYRDTGRYLNITPNLIQIKCSSSQRIVGIFFREFFEAQYRRILKIYCNRFLNEFISVGPKKKFYNTNKIKKIISGQRYDDLNSELYDLGNEYNRDYYHLTYKVKFEGDDRFRKYFSTELFLIGNIEEKKFEIQKLQDIFDSTKGHDDSSENWSGISAQRVSELYEGLDLFKYTKEEEEALKEIKKKHRLDNDDLDHRLWKELLFRKCKVSNAEKIHNELTETCRNLKAEMVSLNHFCDSWLNRDSHELSPRSNKTFRIILEYLGIESSYFRLILKKKAQQRQDTIMNNKKMDALVKMLIDYIVGIKDIKSINGGMFSHFNKQLDLESIAITEEVFVPEIKALCELLNENFKPQKLIKVSE